MVRARQRSGLFAWIEIDLWQGGTFFFFFFAKRLLLFKGSSFPSWRFAYLGLLGMHVLVSLGAF